MKNRNINIIFVILLVALVFFLLFFTEKYSIQNYSTLEKSLIFIGTFLAAYILFNIFEFERTGKNKILTLLKKTHLDIIAYFVGAISLFISSNSISSTSANTIFFIKVVTLSISLLSFSFSQLSNSFCKTNHFA